MERPLVLFVLLSEFDDPVSSSESRSSPVGAEGAVVSTPAIASVCLVEGYTSYGCSETDLLAVV